MRGLSRRRWFLYTLAGLLAVGAAGYVGWVYLGLLEALALVLAVSFLAELAQTLAMERLSARDAMTGAEGMVGAEAVVERDFEGVAGRLRGRVRYRGESWAASTADREPPRCGERVRILAVEGLHLRVTRDSSGLTASSPSGSQSDR